MHEEYYWEFEKLRAFPEEIFLSKKFGHIRNYQGPILSTSKSSKFSGV